MVGRSVPVAMVGREAELSTLRLALEDVRSGMTRCVVVGGEAGVGKTRLLRELGALAREAGLSVHRGACQPDAVGMNVPFAPFSSVLRSVVRSVDARLIDHLAGAGRQELALLLPELGEADPSWASGAGAARLFEAVLALIDRTARRGPGLVLILDDLHWADAAARALLAWLVTELRDARVLIAAGYRSPLAVDAPLRSLVVELARGESVDWFELGPLGPEDAGRLLDALAPVPLDPGRRRASIARSGGVPLYLEELASAPTDGPSPSVRVTVDARMARLDPAARDVVERIAVAGGPVTVALLEQVAQRPRGSLTEALASASEAGLVSAGSGSTDELREVGIRHALLAEAIVASIPPSRLAMIHARWADVLEGDRSAAPRSEMERTAMVARHRLAAGDVPRAIPALLASAEAAQTARAFEAAHADLERVLSLTGPRLPQLVPHPVAVLDAAATAAWLAGAPALALIRTEEAAAFTGASTDPTEMSRRRARRARYRQAAGDPAGAAADLEAAVVGLTGEERWRAQIDLGRALVLSGRAADAIAPCEDALTAAERGGRLRIAARAAAACAVALSRTGRHADAVRMLERASRAPGLEASVAMASRVSRLPDALERHLDVATLLLRDQDPAASLRAAYDGRAAAVARGLDPAFGVVLGSVAAWDLVRLGRWSEAAATLETCRPTGDPGPSTAAWRSVAFWLAAAQGRPLDAGIPIAPQELELLTAIPGPPWAAIAGMASAMTAWSAGGLLAARAVVRQTIRLPIGDEAVAEVALLGVAIEAASVAAAAGRDDPVAGSQAREAAAEHEVRIRAALDRLRSPASAVPTPAERWHRALTSRLEAELARVARAPQSVAWEAALPDADDTGDPWSRALVRLRLAEAIVAEGGNRIRAAALLRESFQLADTLGALPLLEAIERLGRRARIPLRPGLGDDGPRGAALSLGLSEREVDVLTLVAGGRTDREIAQELFITEKTAGHHVSHILAKLAVSRRGEAAAVGHRLGLVAPDRPGPG